MKTWLIDTGPIVSYLDRHDPSHSSVASCLDSFGGWLCTTDAVIVEAMHFLNAARDGPSLLADFLAASEMHIYPSCQPGQIRKAAELMSKYADTPMDFADATIVLLADRLGIVDVITLDRRGFSTYRASRGRPFRRILDLP